LKAKTDSPYDELKPILQEAGILKVTPQTPYIALNYETELAGYMGDFKICGTLSVFLSIGLVLLAVYTAILYCEIYREKIVGKSKNGASILRCVKGHIIFKAGIYAVGLLGVYFLCRASGMGMNYYIIPGTFVLDILITTILCDKIMKGNEYVTVIDAE
jgi:hypothetical protein